MISYLDRAFCSSDCVNTQCYRNFSPEHKAKAEMWAEGMGCVPVAFSDFKRDCTVYVAPTQGEKNAKR